VQLLKNRIGGAIQITLNDKTPRQDMNQENKTSVDINRRIALAGMSAALLTGTTRSWAQGYPVKPIRLVTISPPGGGIDILARILADALSAQLGQAVIVDGKPGGSGVIALSDVLSAKSDGYTLLIATDGLITEVPHSIKVRFEPLKDIKTVAELGDARLALIAQTSLPFATLADFVAYVKGKPAGSVNYGSYGAGSAAHLAGLQLCQAAGIQMTHAPYKGSLPALQDVIGGHLNAAFVGEVGMADQLAAGKIKVLATTGNGRSITMPAVPSFSELGFAGLQRYVVRVNLFVKPDTGKDVRERFRAAIEASLKQSSVQSRFAASGFSAVPQRSESEIEAYIQKQYEDNGAALRAVGMRPE
jgi:tripartite-type tricarboxylate transporter receptor subunit TctC